MIEDYLYTIGKYLSHTQRDEVLKDIEVNLYDYLEEHYGTRPYTDEEIEETLRAMGHPRTVAEAYMTEPRTLIGPALIDTYWLVVKIAVVSIACGLTFANLIDLNGARNSIQLYLGIAIQIVQASLSAMGMITLIFAGIQKYNPDEKAVREEEWSLKILEKAVTKTDQIKFFDLVVETFFMGLALVALNQWLPVGKGSELFISSAASAAFFPYLVSLDLVIVLGLMLNGYLLFKRKWQSFTRIISIVLDMSGVWILTRLALDSHLWSLNPIQVELEGVAKSLGEVFRLSLNIGLAILVLIVAFDIYGHIKALLSERKRNIL